jgi:hypothetical protein
MVGGQVALLGWLAVDDAPMPGGYPMWFLLASLVVTTILAQIGEHRKAKREEAAKQAQHLRDEAAKQSQREWEAADIAAKVKLAELVKEKARVVEEELKSAQEKLHGRLDDQDKKLDENTQLSAAAFEIGNNFNQKWARVIEIAPDARAVEAQERIADATEVLAASVEQAKPLIEK